MKKIYMIFFNFFKTLLIYVHDIYTYIQNTFKKKWAAHAGRNCLGKCLQRRSFRTLQKGSARPADEILWAGTDKLKDVV
jgi:hypothetical protein